MINTDKLQKGKIARKFNLLKKTFTTASQI